MLFEKDVDKGFYLYVCMQRNFNCLPDLMAILHTSHRREIIMI